MQKAQEKKEMTGSKSLVVSIHDVSPSTGKRSEEILADLKSAGVSRVSLLVVPDHHHRGLVSDNPAFATWLREECAAGQEAVLHGFFHLRENKATDDPVKRLITRSYTAGEGEFFDISRQEARRLLDLGKTALKNCGVDPTGFIAPAWLLGTEAEQAVRENGFDYTTRISTVVDFRNGTTHSSRSLVWSVRAAWRRTCSLAWNALLAKRNRNARLMRIGIHPPDWDHPSIRRQILQIIGKALAARSPMTYDGWLSRMRAEP